MHTINFADNHSVATEPTEMKASLPLIDLLAFGFETLGS